MNGAQMILRSAIAGLFIAATVACEEKPADLPVDSANAPAQNPPAPPGPALLSPDSAALKVPAPDSFKVVFETTKGNFTAIVRRSWAPIGVDRFHYLVANGFYNNTRFFRVLPGFAVQFGISGDPSVSKVWAESRLKDEPVKQGNTRGRLTYAKCGMPDCRSTQIFINLGDNSGLDSDGFAAFGEVTEGMSVVESLFSGYGEQASAAQGNITQQGNVFLAQYFPELDYIKTARIIH